MIEFFKNVGGLFVVIFNELSDRFTEIELKRSSVESYFLHAFLLILPLMWFFGLLYFVVNFVYGIKEGSLNIIESLFILKYAFFGTLIYILYLLVRGREKLDE